MAKLYIDGIAHDANEGENLLHSVLSQHLDLPYFCWHPSLGSIGACRQCAVISYANEEDTKGRLMMACMTSVTDGMRISLAAPLAEKFRATVIEWLMANHPHDCPVCEEGGECHLQDMTVMTGHSFRKYEGPKRTWKNQDLGPFIGHEMNRCITCYRCVRFYDDYAGGTDLTALGSRDRMFFGRFEDGTLDSEFSGNLVEVCPTGVFTDKPFAQSYTRKWDLQTAPSVCTHCSVGCNVFPAERYGEFRRITNRYHGEINGYFLCDRGRFGTHFVNHDKRIKHAGVRESDDTFGYGDSTVAITKAASLVKENTIGIGSPRASFENNFALRELVGKENFCIGVNDCELAILNSIVEVLGSREIHVPTLKEVEQADAILIIGEDISNTAARVALSVRQATRLVALELAQQAAIPAWQDAGVRGHAQHEKNPLFMATPASTRLDDVARDTFSGDVYSILGMVNEISGYIAEGSPQDDSFASQVATELRNAKRPLVITGNGLASVDLIHASANLCADLHDSGKKVSLLMIPSEVNSIGAALLGGDLSLSAALERLTSGAPAIVLENDLYQREGREKLDAQVANAELVVLDSLETSTVDHASVVFPAATIVEQSGTMVNYESRAQRFFQVFQPQSEIRPSWQWLQAIAAQAERKFTWNTFEELLDRCASETFPALKEIAPGADYRVGDVLKVPRQTHRYSGRTAMVADVNIHEPKSTVDQDTPLSYSMEGSNPGTQNGATIPYAWSPGWNSNQSVFKFQQEVGGPLASGDPGLRLVNTNDLNWARREIKPPRPEREQSILYTVPVHQVFGSEELSNYSWPIQARSPIPFALFSKTDATNLDLEEGMGVKIGELEHSLEVRIDSRLPAGMIGLSTICIEQIGDGVPTQHVERDVDFVSTNTTNNVIAKG